MQDTPTELTVVLKLRHVPKRGYPDEVSRVGTLAFWDRTLKAAPKYKDPAFTPVFVDIGGALPSEDPTAPTAPDPLPPAGVEDYTAPGEAIDRATAGRVRINPRKGKGHGGQG
ncbi:MAG: hypothetical protein L0Z49_10165 [Actinobacteria bacterium]|nr:hypothetical protein [Actinomycetota bacterium]